MLVPQLLIMGALALLALEAAARIWSFPLKDAAFARIVGPLWNALGVVCLIMARDLDRYRAVAWAPFLGTWLQFARAIHGFLSGELSVVARDLDSAVERCTRLFGWKVHRRGTSDEFGFKNPILPTGIGHIGLLQPTDPTQTL